MVSADLRLCERARGLSTGLLAVFTVPSVTLTSRRFEPVNSVFAVLAFRGLVPTLVLWDFVAAVLAMAAFVLVFLLKMFPLAISLMCVVPAVPDFRPTRNLRLLRWGCPSCLARMGWALSRPILGPATWSMMGSAQPPLRVMAILPLHLKIPPPTVQFSLTEARPCS